MSRNFRELYSDVLLSASSYATVLSAITQGRKAPHKVIHLLAKEEFDSATLWRAVKPLARQSLDESED